MQKFDAYLNIKKKLDIKYKGYDLAPLVSFKLIQLVYHILRFSWAGMTKFFVHWDFGFIEKINKPVFFTFYDWSHRKDYIEIYSYIRSQVPDHESFELSGAKMKVAFKPLNWYNSWREVRHGLKGCPLAWKVSIWLEVCFWKNNIDNLLKYKNPRIKKYVGFNPVHSHEALLTQYFQQHHVKTYSLQHGVTYMHRKDVPLDAINYENLYSDYHLCWGKYTQDELHTFGISAQRLLVAGYPRNIEVEEKTGAGPFNKCIVFLCRKIYHQSNLSLLAILAEFANNNQINFQVKLHPSLDEQEYAGIVSNIGNSRITILPHALTLNTILKDKSFDFALVYNSATYYESYLHHIPCLRFYDNQYDVEYAIDDDIFHDEPSLRLKLDELAQKVKKQAYKQQVDEQLAYVLGYGINDYCRILSTNGMK